MGVENGIIVASWVCSMSVCNQFQRCLYFHAVGVSFDTSSQDMSNHSTMLSSPSEETLAAPVEAVVGSLVMLQLQDSVSVQPGWHCYSEIELAYLQEVYQHPTAQPARYCALGDCLRRLFGWHSSLVLRLLALLANLESVVVLRLNGRRIWLLDLVKVVHLLLVLLMLRVMLSQMRRLED